MSSFQISSLFFSKRDGLPDVLTSYDLMKTVAILLVVIDHIGFIFFPENYWFRALGRGCVPIWCFLIGYSKSRDLSAPIWVWSALLIASSFVTGGGVFPTPILVTFIVSRLILDSVARGVFKDWETLLYGTFFFVMMIIPTMIVADYGSAGFLLVLCGYALRHQKEINIKPSTLQVFMGASVAIFIILELLVFRFPPLEAKVSVVMVGLAAVAVYYFRPMNMIGLTNALPAFVVTALQFTGRRTMEIYAIHLILFKIGAAYLGVSHHGWGEWFWLFPPVENQVPESTFPAP